MFLLICLGRCHGFICHVKFMKVFGFGAGKVIITGTWQSSRVVMIGKKQLISHLRHMRYVCLFFVLFSFDPMIKFQGSKTLT